MVNRWKKYLTAHGALLAVAVGFWGYAQLTRLLFPDGFFHCVLHDLLHLYCPFCGGTRAFLAVTGLDLITAMRMNAAVILAALFCVGLELRALWLLFSKKEGELLPRWVGSLGVVYFSVYGLLINTLLLFGVDPIGDLLGYWQGTVELWRAAFFVWFGTMAVAAFLVAVLPVWRLPSRIRCNAAFVSGFFVVTLLCILYAAAWMLLLYIPLLTGLLCYLFFRDSAT